MNSLWYYEINKEVEHEKDPAEQNAFLVKWLEYARQHGERVWIVAHIPAGYEVFEPYNVVFSEIVTEYKDVIAASFYGHTHDNHFLVVRDIHDQTPLHVNFVTAAFEGYGGNNPSAVMFIIDEETKVVKDYIVYAADFDEMRETGVLTWREKWSIKKEMELEDMSPASITQWAESMWDDEEKFQRYMVRYHTGYYKGDCDHKCKVKNLCHLLYINIDDRQACIDKHM